MLQVYLSSFLNIRKETREKRRPVVKRYNYKNLKIWSLGLEIANDISYLLLNFPTHERYDLSSQISRCSVSMLSNIAEGFSRTDKSFKYFINVALGSSFELGTQLLIAKHRNYINTENLNKLEDKIEEWQKMTMGFQNGLK